MNERRDSNGGYEDASTTSDLRWLESGRWDEWDRFVASHAWGGFVHGSVWKTVIEQSFQHIEGGCCVLADRATGTITAGLPIYRVTSRLLGTRLVSIPFATLSDPLVTSQAELSRLMTAARTEAARVGADRIEIRCTHALEPPTGSEWRVDTGFKCHALPLSRSPVDILASVHPRAIRAMIARAGKTGLRYRSDCSEDSLRGFYRLFLHTRRRLALPPIPFPFFQALHANLSPLGRLSYALVEHGSTLVAAGVFLKSSGMNAIEYLGDRIEFRREGANQLLYWGAIRESMEEGRETFSFGRTSVANEGLLQYKRRWGTQENDLRTLVFPASRHAPGVLREHGWKYRFVSALASASPMPLYRLLGRFCYRHMG